MKVLVIIASHEMRSIHLPNIKVLNDYFKTYENTTVDYAGISNSDDFNNYESIISFKYKVIEPKRQLSKICHFITKYKNELDYDWYVKIRTDILLLEPINFSKLSDTSINARARVYIGPKKIMYGMSINGEGPYKNMGCCSYNECEKEIILDDQLYIFHQNVINLGAFETFDTEKVPQWFDNMQSENEWFHTNCWKSRHIPLNVIGISIIFKKYDAFSGNLNI